MSYALTVERVLEASAEVVFDAFTDAGAQRVWMRDPSDPNLVMATTSTTPDGFRLDTRTEVTFQEQDGKTRMTIVQSGFPTAEIRDYFATTAWVAALEALDTFVGNAGPPKEHPS